ncbi:hypothetical protein IKQ21_03850 [bacterium]|nr:hypothetical protein [bacterium]
MQKTNLICSKFMGINRTSSIYSSSVITASDIQNVELYPTEANSGVGIRTSKGNVSVCSLIPDDETVINIFESVQGGRTYFFVHTESDEEGKVYTFSKDSNTLSEKVSGLTVTGKSAACDVSQGWSDLWVFSNSEELLTIEIGHYEGSTLSEVTIMNPEDADGRAVKGLGIVVYAGRLWVFNGQTVWYSVQEDIYDFSTSDAEIVTSAGYIEFVKEVTAIYPYLGALAVFHKNSSCLITESDGVFSKTMDFPGGCAGYRSLVFHGTELYFYDDTKKGVFCFRQIVNGDKTLGENVAVDIQSELFDIPKSSLDKIQTLSVVTADRNEVWFLIPAGGEDYTTIMIYDYIRRCWLRRKSQKINCIGIVGGILYSGGKKIYEEYVSETFDGEFIEAYYKCAPFNLGSENSLKALNYPPKVMLDSSYGNNFYVEYIKNYDSATYKKHRIKTGSAKNVLYFDIGHWDVSYFMMKNVSSSKKLPVSFFKTLQISFSTKEIGDDFCIRNIEFEKIKVKSI